MPTKPRSTAKKTKLAVKKAKPAADPLQGVRLTHPDRVVYPDVGLTKRDVAEYIVAVAPWMLPHVALRPLSLVRCPGGMAGTCFYQKQPPQGLPSSVKEIKIQIKDTLTVNTYLENAEGLLALVQFGVLESTKRKPACIPSAASTYGRMFLDTNMTTPGEGLLAEAWAGTG